MYDKDSYLQICLGHTFDTFMAKSDKNFSSFSFSLYYTF